MSLSEYQNFAAENPVCYLATQDDGQPHVRVFLFWFADEKGFHFAGLRPKKVYDQLKKNPNVEVCFFNNAPEFPQMKQMRLSGKIEFLKDKETIDRLLADREFYNSFDSGNPEEPAYYAFRISTGEAFFWTMNDILKESNIEHLSF